MQGLPSIEFGPLFYTQVIVGLTPTRPTILHAMLFNSHMILS